MRQDGTCSVVQVGDRFDAGFAGWLAQGLTKLAVGEPGTQIVIDLTEVAPLEEAAVQALWTALGPDLTVAIVTGRLTARRLVRRWGGRRALVFPTVEAAVDALNGAAADGAVRDGTAFRHEALLYEGADAFLDGTAAFITDGLSAGEPVFVAVGAAKVELLRRRLGPDAPRVRFADMDELGRNPARIIPAWEAFVAGAGAGGQPVRGVGEPVTGARTPTEVVECQHHESLLNLAFADSSPWWLLCPYDTTTLASAVVDGARRRHPFVLEGGVHAHSSDYEAPRPEEPFEGSLPDGPEGVAELAFDGASLRRVPSVVAGHAHGAGLRPDEVRDLARAVAEVAANSVAHGGGRGRLRVWREGAAMVCEVADDGHLTDPLAGRHRPGPDGGPRRGLWLANQLSDLVQIRSSAEDGTVVRLRLAGRDARGRVSPSRA